MSSKSVLRVGSIRVSSDGLLSIDGVLSDFSVNLLVKGFDSLNLGGSQSLAPLGELSVVSVLSFFFQLGHIIVNMDSEDSVSMGSGIIRGFFLDNGASGESLSVMGDVKSSVNGSFKGSEDSVTGGGSDETNVQNGFEGLSFLSVVVINRVVFSVNFVVSGVLGVHS